MTDARVTQAAAEVAAQSDNPVAQVTGVDAELAITGAPDAVLTQVVGKVAAQSDAPPARVSQVAAEVASSADSAQIRISQVAVQVLVSWRVKQNFQAIWVE